MSLSSWWFNQISGGAGTLSDIMFLAKKEFDGKMKLQGESDPTTDEGFLSATGDLCSVTAKTGKDLYIARAKITYFTNTTSPSAHGNCEVVLKINGVVVETTNFSEIQYKWWWCLNFQIL